MEVDEKDPWDYPVRPLGCLGPLDLLLTFSRKLTGNPSGSWSFPPFPYLGPRLRQKFLPSMGKGDFARAWAFLSLVGVLGDLGILVPLHSLLRVMFKKNKDPPTTGFSDGGYVQ